MSKKARRHGLLHSFKVVTEESRYSVREYEDRLAVTRCDKRDLTWEELQRVKNLVWGCDVYCVEVYPHESDVAGGSARHIWRGPAVDALRPILTHKELEVEP